MTSRADRAVRALVWSAALFPDLFRSRPELYALTLWDRALEAWRTYRLARDLYATGVLRRGTVLYWHRRCVAASTRLRCIELSTPAQVAHGR